MPTMSLPEDEGECEPWVDTALTGGTSMFHTHPTRTSVRRSRRGFTLIEILIVVSILGILSSVVVTAVSTTPEEAQRATFAASGKTLVEAATRYRWKTGEWLEDASSGVVPNGFDSYVLASQWGATPIGGVWDTELNSFGIVSALGVHFNGAGTKRDDAYMQQIDALVDDGNLGTGGFRKLGADRYYFVLAE
jgi:prepilin-type N-terminal cleavage/methylation domain-containing protein